MSWIKRTLTWQTGKTWKTHGAETLNRASFGMAWSPNARNMTSAAEVPHRNFLYGTMRKQFVYDFTPVATHHCLVFSGTNTFDLRFLVDVVCPGWQHGGRATTTRWTAPLSCPKEKSCWLLTLTSCEWSLTLTFSQPEKWSVWNFETKTFEFIENHLTTGFTLYP